jgi:hydrogenase maturation protease
MRVLIGSVGYRNLSDHSFGIEVVDALASRTWPESVAVEDLSYNPIAVAQRLQDEAPGCRFELAIVVSAVDRPGRDAGSLSIYRWDNGLPAASDIQAAVADAVTGIISLDNTLVVARNFGGLPEAVVVVEIQPRTHDFGAELSPEVRRSFVRACEIVAALATNPAGLAGVPVAALGGGAALSPRPPGSEVKSGIGRRGLRPSAPGPRAADRGPSDRAPAVPSGR